MIRRREFITLLGGAAVAWPLAARGQQGERVRRIGVLLPAAADDAVSQARLGAFLQTLGQLDWSIGHNVRIDTRWATTNAAEIRRQAAELAVLAPDVVLAFGASTVGALLQATRTVPIVFPGVVDPVGAGFVETLSRPGGNATGLSMQSTDIAGKRLELLREVIPGLRRLAILGHFGNPNNMLEMGEVQAAARTLGLEVAPSDVQRAEPTFEALKGCADAVYVCNDPLFLTNRIRINILAQGARLPTMYGFREHVETGGLMSYGSNFPDLFRRAGDYVDKILRGAKPGDIPVEQPTKFHLVINLTTAKALGLEVPAMLLARADEVIE